jgi:hypothetical protein
MLARSTLTLILVLAIPLAACREQAAAPSPPATPLPPPPAPPPAPPPPPPPLPPPAPPPAPESGPTAEDRARFADYDRANLRKHLALLAFVQKARAAWDQAAIDWQGKADAPARVEKLQKAQRAAIAAQARALQALAAGGERSFITGDHDTNLHFLADEYPTSVISAAAGDPAPLTEVRGEMDRNEKKISSWLQELRPAAK